MKTRTFGITLVQILLIICGLVGSFFLVNLCIPVFKVLFTEEGNLGDALVAALIGLPFILIISPAVCIDGIITTIIAANQRKKFEKKDGLALAFLIIGIIFIVLSIIILAFVLSRVGSDSSSSEAIVMLLR